MAIVKIVLLAAMPFIAAPFVSTQSGVISATKSSLDSAASGIASDSQSFKTHNETTIYKSQSDGPDFMDRHVQDSDDPLLFAPSYKASVSESRKYLEV
jgi:hypothetical protein